MHQERQLSKVAPELLGIESHHRLCLVRGLDSGHRLQLRQPFLDGLER